MSSKYRKNKKENITDQYYRRVCGKRCFQQFLKSPYFHRTETFLSTFIQLKLFILIYILNSNIKIQKGKTLISEFETENERSIY